MTDPRDQAIEVLRATGAIYGPTLTANERVVDALIGAGLLTRNPDNEALADVVNEAMQTGLNDWALAVSKAPETYSTERREPYQVVAIVDAVLGLIGGRS